MIDYNIVHIMNNNLIRDLATAILILFGLVVSVLLINIGMTLLLLIGLLTPGWVLIFLAIIIIYRQNRRFKNK